MSSNILKKMIHVLCCLTCYYTTNFGLFQTADDSFKFDENGRKFSRQGRKRCGKGDVARYEQFLLFPLSFQKTCTADRRKQGLIVERVKE